MQTKRHQCDRRLRWLNEEYVSAPYLGTIRAAVLSSTRVNSIRKWRSVLMFAWGIGPIQKEVHGSTRCARVCTHVAGQ